MNPSTKMATENCGTERSPVQIRTLPGGIESARVMKRSLRWSPLRRGDKLAIALAIFFVLLMLSLPFLPKQTHPANWGFGSSWDCTNNGVGEPLCERNTSNGRQGE